MKRSIIIASLLVLSYSSIGQFNFSIGGGISFADEGFAPALVFEPKAQVSETIRVGIASRLGLDSYFKSFYADLNIKPSERGSFYFGLGAGWTTFELIQKLNFLPRGGAIPERGIEFVPSFIPSVGFQDKVDINLSVYIGEGYFL